MEKKLLKVTVRLQDEEEVKINTIYLVIPHEFLYNKEGLAKNYTYMKYANFMGDIKITCIEVFDCLIVEQNL